MIAPRQGDQGPWDVGAIATGAIARGVSEDAVAQGHDASEEGAAVIVGCPVMTDGDAISSSAGTIVMDGVVGNGLVGLTTALSVGPKVVEDGVATEDGAGQACPAVATRP